MAAGMGLTCTHDKLYGIDNGTKEFLGDGSNHD